jgi:hypothetical protein
MIDQHGKYVPPKKPTVVTKDERSPSQTKDNPFQALIDVLWPLHVRIDVETISTSMVECIVRFPCLDLSELRFLSSLVRSEISRRVEDEHLEVVGDLIDGET